VSVYQTSDLISIFVNSDTICTDGYRTYCDLTSNLDYLKRDFLYRAGCWRGKHYQSFVSRVWSQGHSGAVVMGHSDYSTTYRDVAALYLLGIRRVFATNAVSIPKVSWCLPLGLTNNCDDQPTHQILGDTSQILRILREIPKRSEFANSILLSFNVNTALRYRKEVASLFTGESAVNSIQLNYSVEGRYAYLRAIREHDFVLCPRGNGVDTHRLYETLYLGAIPIVKANHLNQSLAREFPIWIVRDWREVLDPAQRIRAWKQLHERHWESQRLRQTYWNNFIAERCAGQTI